MDDGLHKIAKGAIRIAPTADRSSPVVWRAVMLRQSNGAPSRFFVCRRYNSGTPWNWAHGCCRGGSWPGGDGLASSEVATAGHPSGTRPSAVLRTPSWDPSWDRGSSS
ncbi:hypothetical protein SY2F82_36370 [Streptomyces sp. Y2F8-2]|nr:hypothetical protein SY2F82_36370 [Streptomyces sp. Y2F8-2]